MSESEKWYYGILIFFIVMSVLLSPFFYMRSAQFLVKRWDAKKRLENQKPENQKPEQYKNDPNKGDKDSHENTDNTNETIKPVHNTQAKEDYSEK